MPVSGIQNEWFYLENNRTNQYTQVTWFSHKNGSAKQFQVCVELQTNYLKAIQPKAILLDTLCFDWTIPIEIQEWISREVIGECSELHQKKIALVRPMDWVTNLSVEQTIEEHPILQAVTSFFTEKWEAQEWLYNG